MTTDEEGFEIIDLNGVIDVLKLWLRRGILDPYLGVNVFIDAEVYVGIV